MAEIERAGPLELRISGRVLTGNAMVYGSRARDRAEMFEPMALQPVDGMPLVLQHDRSREIARVGDGLDLRHTPESLGLKTELRAGSAELSLVRRRALTGLSVEFRAVDEYRSPEGLRVVRRAICEAVGLVDVSSYPGQVELRQFEDAWLTGEVRYGRPMQCTCQGGGCEGVEFEPGAFSTLGEDRVDLLAVGGQGFASVLGSLRRGTLLVEETRDALRIGLTNSQTEAARQVMEAASVAPVLARPIIDVDASDYVDDGPVRRFSRAAVTGFLIKASPNDEGHIPVKVRGIEERCLRRPRRRRWL